MAEESLVPWHPTTALPERRWWGFTGEYNKSLSLVYTLAIWDLENNLVLNTSTPLNPASHPSDPTSSPTAVIEPCMYHFTTPPKSYEITENAATSIVPTQDGGKFIESHGNIFKEISISGTVGFRPNPHSSELIPGLASSTGVSLTVPPIFQSKDERGLHPSEKTGFDEIIHLRNIFRHYFDLKSDPDMARKVVMLWMYMKESELYVVEPISFTTSRDSSNPLGWNYSIQLKTLNRWDVTLGFIKDPLNIFQQLGAAMDAMNSAVDSILGAMNQLSAAIDFLTNLPANLVNSIMGPIQSILHASLSLANTTISFPITVKQSVLKTLSNACRDIRAIIDTDMAALSATVSKYDPPAVIKASDIGSSTHAGKIGSVRNAINKIDRSAKTLFGLDVLWEQQRQRQISSYSGSYVDAQGNPPFTAGSPLLPDNIVIPNSAKEVRIEAGEDIRSISKKFLGREDKWKVIAIINDLKYPYISDKPGPGVLTPNDNILIPIEERRAARGIIPRVTNPDAQSESEGPALRKYGRDLRLKDTAIGVDLGDLVISNRGDLDVISGVANVEQGMKIKFSTEQGGLPLHPEFGARYPIGTKVHLPRLQEFAVNTRRTIMSDHRVSSITAMSVFSEGDQIIIRSRVQLKSSNFQLPITFAVRR